MASSLAIERGELVYRTPYNMALVTDLKTSIPSTERRWDGARKAWIVAPRHEATLRNITLRHLGEHIACQASMIQDAPTIETRAMDIRYIGATKERGGDDRSAFGHCMGQWSVIFPEAVLREWFCAVQRPGETPTLYTALGIRRDAATTEVRTAYRRLAKLSHPDVNHEPTAADDFRAIQHAWEILGDPAMRAKYDAGLRLTESAPAESNMPWFHNGYRPPLRCGVVLAEGTEILGRFVVSRILAWADITNMEGRVLSTSWPMGAETFVETWV